MQPRSLRIGIFALILFLTIPTALAQQESSSLYSGIYRVNSINIELKANGIVDVTEELVVDKPEARILLPKTSGLEISDSGGKLEYTSDLIYDEQVVTFNPRSHFPESDGRVLVSYTSDYLTHKSGSVWTLKFSSVATPAHTEVEVIFPWGAKILDLRSDAPRYPANLSSPLSMYPQDNRFSFDCDYEVEEMKGVIPVDLIIIVFVIIMAAIALIVMVLKGRKKDEGTETKEQKTAPPKDEKEEQDAPSEAAEGKGGIKESVLNMLDEREKEIIRVIEGSGEEEITQAYIYKTTGIPKATLSDIMKRLESRNIIESTPEGRTKWIKLKKWVFD